MTGHLLPTVTGRHNNFAPRYASSSVTPTPVSNAELCLSCGSLYHSVPLPGMPACLHPILTAQYPRAIEYDLTIAPHTMRPFTYAMPSDLCAQQASLPPVPFLKIYFPGTPWHVTVFPSSQHVPGVTVGDVFTAIYISLRTNVSKHEYESAPSDAHRKAAAEAYNARVTHMHPSLRDFERAKGLKRIDFLGKRRHFLGLMPVNIGTVNRGTGGLTLIVE